MKRDDLRKTSEQGAEGKSPGDNRLPILAALLVCAALVAVVVGMSIMLTSPSQPVAGGPTTPQTTGATEAFISYTTEGGEDVAEGAADSPLKVTARFPRRSESDEDALSAVLMQLVDEQGVAAQFGAIPPKTLDMHTTVDLAVWTYSGSMPSNPGVYYPRFTLRRVFGDLPPETVEVASAPIRIAAEAGAPLRSGYVYNDGSDLWLLATDASKRRRLTFLGLKDTNEYAEAPAWSPDGKSIAFTYLPEVAQSEAPATDIWTIAPDGTGMKPLVGHGPDESLSNPYWSGDGEHVYFTVEVAASDPTAPGTMLGISVWRIYRVEVATGARSKWADMALSPSTGGPAGDVVYLEVESSMSSVADQMNGVHRLVRARADGSERTVLVDNIPAYTVIGPRLSPDGKWVVYASVLGGGSGSGGVGEDGGSQSRGFDLFRWLTFQPEVAEAHGLPWDLFIVSASGEGEPMRLTTLGDDEPHAVWLDSSTVAFMGTYGFFTQKIDGAGKAVGSPVRLGEGVLHAVLGWHGP